MDSMLQISPKCRQGKGGQNSHKIADFIYGWSLVSRGCLRPLLVFPRKAGQAPNEGRLQLRCMDAETLSLIRILWLGMKQPDAGEIKWCRSSEKEFVCDSVYLQLELLDCLLSGRQSFTKQTSRMLTLFFFISSMKKVIGQNNNIEIATNHSLLVILILLGFFYTSV